MNLKSIEKSQKFFNELKQLDSKIIELEKFAIQVNDGATDLKVSLSLLPKKDLVKDSVLDSDGSLKNGESKYCSYTFSFSGFYSTPAEPLKTNNLSISELIGEADMFLFCELLLQSYKQRRQFLITKIEAICQP